MSHYKPIMHELPAGTYVWCRCGRSRNQPFCDGRHTGSGTGPMRFEVAPKAGRLWFCTCKQTSTPPYCDGTHNKVPGPDSD